MKIAKSEKQNLRPRLQEHLKRLRDWSGPDFMSKLHNRDDKSSDFLDAEILVMALRKAWRANTAELAEEIAIEILERWGKFILKIACNRFPATSQEWKESEHNQMILGAPSLANAWLTTGKRAEMLQEVYSLLWERLKDRSKRDWEWYFTRRLRFLCLDVAKSMGHSSWGSWDPDLEVSDEQQHNQAADSALGVEEVLMQRDLLDRAFSTLPPKQATAVYLRHVLGWPVAGGSGPTGLTVSQTMGITDRMVRIHIRAAERTLGIHLAEEMGL